MQENPPLLLGFVHMLNFNYLPSPSFPPAAGTLLFLLSPLISFVIALSVLNQLTPWSCNFLGLSTKILGSEDDWKQEWEKEREVCACLGYSSWQVLTFFTETKLGWFHIPNISGGSVGLTSAGWWSQFCSAQPNNLPHSNISIYQPWLCLSILFQVQAGWMKPRYLRVCSTFRFLKDPKLSCARCIHTNSYSQPRVSRSQ